MALWLLYMLISFFSAKCAKNVANFTEIDCRENGFAVFKTLMLYILTSIIGKKKSNSTQGYVNVRDK